VANAEARLNAIRELGRLKDRRALPTLWELAGAREESDTAQRDTAIRAIGEIGDPDSLDRLSALYNRETDDGLRIVLDKAMARIREQHHSDGGSK
jgi:HEAT repeat protein